MKRTFFVCIVALLALLATGPTFADSSGGSVAMDSAPSVSQVAVALPAEARIVKIEASIDTLVNLVAIEIAVTGAMLVVLCVTLTTAPPFVDFLKGNSTPGPGPVLPGKNPKPKRPTGPGISPPGKRATAKKKSEAETGTVRKKPAARKKPATPAATAGPAGTAA